MPAAVGLDARGRGASSAYPRGAPVVTVHGGRGTGKTALCERLHEIHVNRIHVAKWPMTGARPGPVGPPPDQSDPLASRPLAALAYLVQQLDASVPRFGRIEFPRFTYGLIAATTLDEPPDAALDGADGGPGLADLRLFRDKQRDLEEALRGNGPEPPLRESFRALAVAAVPLLRWTAPGLAPLEDLVRHFVTHGLGGEGGGRGLHAVALRWWDGQLRDIAGSGIRKLLGYVLSLRYQVTARARHDLEERLTAAFLADIDAHHRRPHLRIHPLPLLLLDDTHTPAGSRLLDLLLTAYARAAGPDNARGGKVGRPVIVATELSAADRPAGAGIPHPLTVAQLDTLKWDSPHSDAPGAWRVRLRAPALRAESVGAALGSPCPQGLPNVIEQLSAGRPGCAWPLVEAAREDLRTGTRSVLLRCEPEELGPALLGLPPAGAAREPTVADSLLRYLVPERALMDSLLPWAAALRPDDLPDLPPPRAEQHAAHSRIRAFLGADHWYRCAWAGDEGFLPVVADRTLRELLLHRLRTVCTPAPGESGTDDAFGYWTRLHTAARDRRGRPAPDGDGTAYTAYLHHSLALGHHETVVAGLHTLFGGSDRSTWLAALQFVCAAPRPPSGYPVRGSGARPSCPACPGPEPDHRHLAIGRLVRVLGDLSTLSSLYTDDPDSPDNELRRLLGGLDVTYGHQDAATAQAARRWPVLLAQGRRVPELPVTRRDH
ncbi:hypothetical protein GCM10018793_47220 [Streptomyces sulfonofaciens]|uniref:Uncharacterized protein n=1 Tax=Streptomyces sulfonofaciens TaxID=68272 RepID=A0A919L5B2_9ACTN|nr:hypothetical protein GCM10018793_47220 [Streptomyces sulfonofaciens]